MAATAYASLVSLLNTMDQIESHPLLSTCFDNYQFQSLRETVDFLIDFVENYSKEAEDLMRPIGDAAREVEDMIEVEAAHRIIASSASKSLTMMLRLEKMIREMSFIKEKVIKFIKETPSAKSMPPPSSLPSSSSAPQAAKKTTMLGFDGYVAQLLDELIGHDSRRTLPIVGMGGAGKSTLAKYVYEDSRVVYHFDVRSWVTVSQDYSATHMLSQALSCLRVGDIENKTDDQLGQKLHQTLFGQRYMIVLDDVWSVAAWEKIKPFFPENGNGSRIVVTTREQEVVNYFGSTSLAVGFLDYQNSWDLFCEATFTQQNCPPQLQEIAKIIVTKCRGLPLAIRVIGGLLRKGPRTKEYWEEIKKDKSLVMEYSGEGNKPSSILYMSYKHLPVRLKSCFLHLGLFPEDHKIKVSRLIKLWVAEGFIKASKNENLEQVAESYIKALVDRNLLLADSLTDQNKVEYYFVHDLVRELCIKTAEKEDFYCVQRDLHGRRHYIFDERWASFYLQESLYSEKPSVVKPLILSLQRETPFMSRLLRVFHGNGESILDNSLKQINLRYIYHKYVDTSAIPRSISLCWSLQTLIMYSWVTVFLPPEIWKMPQLRHIDIRKHLQFDPPAAGEVSVLQNLQINTVKNLIFSEELCAKIPNIRELDILYDDLGEESELHQCFHLNNVGCLSKLESLTISFRYKFKFAIISDRRNLCIDDDFKLPNSLRELTLGNCTIGRRGMAMIASLPHLQLLDLLDEVPGAELTVFEHIFPSLKYLRISDNCLINWIADKSNFPVLQTLYLLKLKEIPLDIGEISEIKPFNL